MTKVPEGLIDPKSYYEGYEDGKKQVKLGYMEPLETEAIDLAAAIDNPASVMIRRLLDRIADLKTANEIWSDRNWTLMAEIDKLNKQIQDLKDNERLP